VSRFRFSNCEFVCSFKCTYKLSLEKMKCEKKSKKLSPVPNLRIIFTHVSFYIIINHIIYKRYLRHGGPVRIRVEKHRHGLVRRQQHKSVQRTDPVNWPDVFRWLINVQELPNVPLQRKWVQYLWRGAWKNREKIQLMSI